MVTWFPIQLVLETKLMKATHSENHWIRSKKTIASRFIKRGGPLGIYAAYAKTIEVNKKRNFQPCLTAFDETLGYIQ